MGPGHGQHLIGVIPDSASHTLPRSKTARQFVGARKSPGRLPSTGIAFQRVMYGDILRRLQTLSTDTESPHPPRHPSIDQRPVASSTRGVADSNADVHGAGKTGDHDTGCRSERRSVAGGVARSAATPPSPTALHAITFARRYWRLEVQPAYPPPPSAERGRLLKHCRRPHRFCSLTPRRRQTPIR